MQEAVTDGIGERGLADEVVVLGRGQLAGDDGRTGAIAILEDLEQVTPLMVLEWGQGKVVPVRAAGDGGLILAASSVFTPPSWMNCSM